MTQPVQTEQPPDPGEELQKQLQYIRLWRVSVRLEYASLAAIAVLALLFIFLTAFASAQTDPPAALSFTNATAESGFRIVG